MGGAIYFRFRSDGAIVYGDPSGVKSTLKKSPTLDYDPEGVIYIY
jgi:hypothetical protein